MGCECPDTYEFSLMEGETETHCEVTIYVVSVGSNYVDATIQASWEEDDSLKHFNVGTHYDILDSDEYVKAYVECFKILYDYAYFRVCYVKKVAQEPNFIFVKNNCMLYWNSEMCFMEQTKNVPEGVSVGAYVEIKNDGNGAGRPDIYVVDSEGVICSKTGSASPLIQSNSIANIYLENCFSMGSSNKYLEIQVHWNMVWHDSVGCETKK